MAVYDVDKIENWYNDFKSCKGKYQSKYNNFKKSYFYSSYDNTVVAMRNKLNSAYQTVDDIYYKIDVYWRELVEDLKGIENAIKNDTKASNIHSSSVAAAINSLPQLPIYDVSVKQRFGSGGAKASSIWYEITYNPEVVGATVASAFTSVVEGVAMIGEALYDVSTMAVAAVATVFTAMDDLYGYIEYKMTGDESNLRNSTKELWDETRAGVSETHVKSAFDGFYENTEVGSWIKNNSFAFDSVRSIGCEIGIVVGSVAISASSGGLVPPSVIYGITKAGIYTEEEWQNENQSTLQGLLKGFGKGALDGIFFEIGSGGDKVVKTIVSKTGSTAVKVGVLGGKVAFESATAVAQDCGTIFINTVFSSNTVVDSNGQQVTFNNFSDKWNYYFEDYGGVEALTNSVITAGVLSAITDANDVFNITSNIGGNIKTKIQDRFGKVNVDANQLDNGIDNASKKVEVKPDVEANKIGKDVKSPKAEIDVKNSNVEIKSNKISKDVEPPKVEMNVKNPDVEVKAKHPDVGVRTDELFDGVNPNSKKGDLSSTLENSIIQEKTLKDEILKTLDDNLNEIQKARKLYIELNKRINYDIDYVVGDDKTKKQILEKVTNFDNVTNNKVVCKGWSELYSDLLISAGVDPDKVKIVRPDNANHWWVEIDIGDNMIIRADATDALLGAPDLSNCKANNPTNNFLLLNKQDSGLWVKNDILRKHPEVLEHSNNYFKGIDGSIGYIKGNDYFSDSVSKLRESFDKKKKRNLLLDEEKLVNKKIKKFIEMDVPKNMNGYDAYAYYRKFMNTLFVDDNIYHSIKILRTNIDGKYYSAIQISLGGLIVTFDEIRGKEIFNFKDYVDGPSKRYEGLYDRIRGG